jgi:hypothetical protein
MDLCLFRRIFESRLNKSLDQAMGLEKWLMRNSWLQIKKVEAEATRIVDWGLAPKTYWSSESLANWALSASIGHTVSCDVIIILCRHEALGPWIPKHFSASKTIEQTTEKSFPPSFNIQIHINSYYCSCKTLIPHRIQSNPIKSNSIWLE